MLIYLIIGVASRQINNVSEHIVQLNHSAQYWQQDIELGIEYDIHNYSHGGAVLQSSLTGDHADLCQVINENIHFNEPHIVQIISEVFDYKDGYITQNELEDLVGMVHQNQSVAMVGNTNHIYQLEFNTLLPMKYNITQQVGEFRCGIFNPELQYTYIIYTNYIVYYQDINNIMYQQNNCTDVVDVETSQIYVYIATKDGVQIFEIRDGGSLLNLGHIDDLESIVDISIGGVTGQSLYILYHSGVVVYNVYIGDTGLNIRLNENLALIPIEGGYKMDQVNDESLLVLVKVGQSHAAVMDFCIDLLDGYWFVVNKYMVQGEPRDIDMTDEIAILQGIDGHTVIYHSVFNLFQQHKQADKVLYIPGAISLDFYEPTFGIQNLPSHWHYNQTRNELFGINSNQLFLIPWSTIVPIINCKCTDESLVGQSFNFTIITQTTNCIEKDTIGDVLSRDLVVCNYNDVMTLNVLVKQDKLVMVVLFSVVIGLIVMLAIGIILFVVFHRKYSNEVFSMGKRLEAYSKIKQSRIELPTHTHNKFSIESEI